MVGGIIILTFSISSILTLIQSNRWAGITASIDFILLFVDAIIILLSLSCRIPFDFYSGMIVTPRVITVTIIVGLYTYYEKKNKEQRLKRVMDK
ncbi:MAG: hypothetical protein M3Z01_03845 [Thermoproteota archaeon]|nr:hypothetical protein [Thermoproteota archaeon]